MKVRRYIDPVEGLLARVEATAAPLDVPRSPDEWFESGEHLARAWRFEGRTFGDESVLHIDDDQGATRRIDGEEIFSSDAWVGHWGSSNMRRANANSPTVTQLSGQLVAVPTPPAHG